MALYLSVKEIWRNKGRFFLFSLVIALIAILVLYTAGLASGLASANKEYLEKLRADVLVFKSGVNYSTIESRIEYDQLRRILLLEGVAEAGPIAFSNAKIVFDSEVDSIDVSFIGVDPGKPGAPNAVLGDNLRFAHSKVVLVDQKVAEDSNVSVGDFIKLSSTQGEEDEVYELRVVGITDGQQYFFRPSIFVSLPVWDRYRPKATAGVYRNNPDVNVVAVLAKDSTRLAYLPEAISAVIDDVETTDIQTAYESAPGYSEQQATLGTLQGFTLLIGTLVIGGFFQIQTLQKIPQIGMLKAIGTPDRIVASMAILQIIFVTIIGVLLGGLVTLGLVVGMPDNIPIQFSGSSVLTALIALLLIGPVGGMVSIRLALKVEPLTALGM